MHRVSCKGFWLHSNFNCSSFEHWLLYGLISCTFLSQQICGRKLPTDMRFYTEVGLLWKCLTLSHSVRIPTITTEVLAGPDCEFSSWSTHRRNFPSSSFCLRHHHFASVHSVCFALRDLERDWLTGNVGKLSARSAFQYYPNDSYRFAPCVLWQTWNLRIRQCVMVRLSAREWGREQFARPLLIVILTFFKVLIW